MADKELAEKLARRLAAEQNEDIPAESCSKPPPPPNSPQKVVENPYVPVDNTVSIDDLIQRTLDKQEKGEENNNAPFSEPESTSNRNELLKSPPPKTSIRDLLVKEQQQIRPASPIQSKCPMVAIEHHRKPEPSRTGVKPVLPSDDGSELERKLAAQRMKKATIPAEPTENLIYSNVSPASTIAGSETPKQNIDQKEKVVEINTEEAQITSTECGTSAIKPRKTSFEELEEMFERELESANKTIEHLEKCQLERSKLKADTTAKESSDSGTKTTEVDAQENRRENEESAILQSKPAETLQVTSSSQQETENIQIDDIVKNQTTGEAANEPEAISPPTNATKLEDNPTCDEKHSTQLETTSTAENLGETKEDANDENLNISPALEEDCKKNEPKTLDPTNKTEEDHLTKGCVPTPQLIDMIRAESGMKSPPPLPPPKPCTPTNSRPQSPVVKKPFVSPLGLMCDPLMSVEGEKNVPNSPVQKKPSTPKPENPEELAALLERRNKIIEGDTVPQFVNRKLSLYAEFSEFTRKQIKFFSDTFKKYDEDQDGFIDFNELKRMMEKMGEAQTHIALKEIIKKVDEDKDGKISFREFLLLFRMAAQGHFGCSEVFTKLAESVDVTKEGVLGAASFFQAKIAEQTKLSKFEEEIKEEQEERKREEEEKRQRKEKFLQSKSLFH